VALLLIAQSIFVEGYPLDYLFLTLLIWAAFRFGPHGAFMAIFVIAVISILKTGWITPLSVDRSMPQVGSNRWLNRMKF